MSGFMACDHCGKVLPNNELRFYVLASNDGASERADLDFCSAVCIRNWLAETYPNDALAPVVPIRAEVAIGNSRTDICPGCGGSGLGDTDPVTGLRPFCGHCDGAGGLFTLLDALDDDADVDARGERGEYDEPAAVPSVDGRDVGASFNAARRPHVLAAADAVTHFQKLRELRNGEGV